MKSFILKLVNNLIYDALLKFSQIFIDFSAYYIYNGHLIV